MASFTGISELKESYRKLGPLRFWSLMVATLGFIGVGAGLSISLNYPDAYGFPCHGKGCFLSNVWHSPILLQDGQPLALALFVWLWSMPCLVLFVTGWALIKKLRRADLSIFEQPDGSDSSGREL